MHLYLLNSIIFHEFNVGYFYCHDVWLTLRSAYRMMNNVCLACVVRTLAKALLSSAYVGRADMVDCFVGLSQSTCAFHCF